MKELSSREKKLGLVLGVLVIFSAVWLAKDHLNLDLLGRELKVKKNQLLFTFNQVPIIYDINHPIKEKIIITYLDGSVKKIHDSVINFRICKDLFTRKGNIDSIQYFMDKKNINF